jgi:hypothetical protein
MQTSHSPFTHMTKLNWRCSIRNGRSPWPGLLDNVLDFLDTLSQSMHKASSRVHLVLYSGYSYSNMKAIIAAITFALPLVALASPRIPDEPPIKTPQTCKLTGDGVRHRKCPCTGSSKKCTANGEYFLGDKVSIKCYTTGSTVDGYV